MSIIFKKNIQAAGAKKISCALIAVCMVIAMLFGIVSIIPAIAAPNGKMLEVYNQSGWNGQQIEQQYNALPAGTYELSGYFKHEGGWSIQTAIYNNGWIQAPGVTVAELENEYFTTIEFTLTSPANFSVIFKAPANTNKLWIAGLTLREKSDTQDVNLLKNGDFSNGTTSWGFTNKATAFSNATTKDIDDGFFDKDTGIQPPSGNMMQVYNQSGWDSQSLYRRVNALSAGTYKLSVYYKHEGGWNLSVLQSSSMDGNYTEVPGAIVTESENEYFTTITFTLTSTAYIRAQFDAPTSQSKLWLANLSLRHISGGADVGRCTNYYGNPDFTVTSGVNPAGLAYWTFTNLATAFANAQAMDIEEGFFDKATSTDPTSNKMLEVYNQSGWNNQQLEQQCKSLPAGTYELSGYFKHEGGWNMQAMIESDGRWIQAPGATVTELESEYFTTIEFTLDSTTNFSVVFKAPANTNKLWIAGLTLRKKTDTQDVNLLKNGNFSNGTTNWSFTNKDDAFSNAQTKDCEDSFFDKAASTDPTSSKMLEVYNQNKWSGQQLEQQCKSLPAGTYVLSGYFKHEGGWSIQAQVYNNGWIQVPGATVSESENKYFTTIEFTLDSTTNFSVVFKAPENTNKLWIADITLRKKTDAQDVNLIKNGNFSNGTTNWSFTNKDTTFSNAQTKDIEDGFFDKTVEIVSPSGNMMQVYNQSGWGDQLLYRRANALPAGTYKLSVYYKHEGGWSMRVLQSDEMNGRYVQVQGATVIESENEYFTTITFTLTSTAYIRAQFDAPTSKSKMWLANLSLQRISGGEWGRCTNYFGNPDFTVTRDGLPEGLAFWTFTNFDKAFANAQAMEIPDGFFNVPEKQMAVLYNQNPSWGGQILEAIIGTIPAGDYVFSANFKHDGSWSVGPRYWDGTKWASIPGAQTVKSTDEYKTTVSFTLASTQNVRIFFNAPKNTGVAYIANVKLYRIDVQSHNYITNGTFANEFKNWHYANDSFDNMYLDKIPEDFFLRGSLTQQMIHVKDKGGSGTINQWVYLKKDAEYCLSYDINYVNDPDDVVGAAAYVNIQYPTSSGSQYYLPYSIDVSEDRYTKKYEIRVHDLAVTSNGEAKMLIGLQMMPREAYIANIKLTEKGKTENLLNNADFIYGFEDWNQEAACIELVPYDDSKFIRTQENTPLTDKYMLYSDGSSSYDDFGQHLKLPRTSGTTEIMYEFQCRYRATDGFPALRMAYHPVGATRFADDARNQGSFNVYSEYDDETGYWYGIFTIPKSAYIDKDGLAHIFLSVNTELSGAGYFTDFKLFDITNDENRTKNLLANPDFKQGLWGWVGKGMWTVPELNFNTLKFTECKDLFSLVPYDEKMFIKSDSEQYFDDGEWWIKYGEQKVEKEDNSVITQVIKGKLIFNNGEPISGAPLVLRSDQVYYTLTEMDGSFEFKDIPVGKYSLYMGMEDGSELFIIEFALKLGDVITVSAAYNLQTGEFEGISNIVSNTVQNAEKDPEKDNEKYAEKVTEKDTNIFVLLLIILGSMVIIAVIMIVIIWWLKKYRAIRAQSK